MYSTIIATASYVTLEAEIAHDRAVVKEPGQLPESAQALVAILGPITARKNPVAPTETLDALPKHRKLNESKSADWMTAVRDARSKPVGVHPIAKAARRFNLQPAIQTPKKVTRAALQNAASIAELLLTTERLTSEIPGKASPGLIGSDSGIGMGLVTLTEEVVEPGDSGCEEHMLKPDFSSLVERRCSVSNQQAIRSS